MLPQGKVAVEVTRLVLGRLSGQVKNRFKLYMTVIGLKETALGLGIVASLVALSLNKVIPSTVAFYEVSKPRFILH